jgi:hypothetical protein
MYSVVRSSTVWFDEWPNLCERTRATPKGCPGQLRGQLVHVKVWSARFGSSERNAVTFSCPIRKRRVVLLFVGDCV